MLSDASLQSKQVQSREEGTHTTRIREPGAMYFPRSFDASSVEPKGLSQVTITVRNVGTLSLYVHRRWAWSCQTRWPRRLPGQRPTQRGDPTASSGSQPCACSGGAALAPRKKSRGKRSGPASPKTWKGMQPLSTPLQSPLCTASHPHGNAPRRNFTSLCSVAIQHHYQLLPERQRHPALSPALHCMMSVCKRYIVNHR